MTSVLTCSHMSSKSDVKNSLWDYRLSEYPKVEFACLKTKTTPILSLRAPFGFDVPLKRHSLQAPQFFDPSLHPSQQAAVKLALEAMGPPGVRFALL